ncbi:MAG: RNA polymerase factor sigma-54 [Zoogloeaceae bacterium]|jgi:RNA polymerase sigma-54 factor|nr:RNA polymerase factor sigma-54 [Zoogloeaceae bacterium]
MKPSLQIKLSQQLALTPQLQQAIKLLQLSTLDMNQEIERYLQDNPLLEREEENLRVYEPVGNGMNGKESIARDDRETVDVNGGERQTPERAELSPADVEEDRWFQDSGSYGNSSGASRDDEEADAQDLQPATATLHDHICWQINLSRFSDKDKALIRFLAEGLDDDGYLSASLEELQETIPPEYEIDIDDLEIALKQLQSLDPTGVGARSPRECLSLQLKAMTASPSRDLALSIVERCLDLLAGRDFGKIMKQMSCASEELKAAHALIVRLDPRPGASFTPLNVRYIIPDVIVRKVRGRWVSQINPDAYPKLRINRLYAEILAGQRRGDGALSGQLQEARWLIKNVQQRFDTIARVSQAIVERQRKFFEHGEVAMRPLVLREIADILDLHESTVSRVTSQKYMSTPRGIFELKYFFGSHVSTDSGGACSATAIRALIKQLIGAESGTKPLSDSQLSEILGRQGVVVARRTVAKYREALNIPPVNLRKTL